MSFFKLFQIPTNLFRKDVISFFNIKRHDLGVIEDKLRYIAIRPTATLLQIRRKLWHLLDLPDYCEEIIILKNENEQEIPLERLRHSNDPQHPYILEVWLPDKRVAQVHHMNALGDNQSISTNLTNSSCDANPKMIRGRESSEKTRLGLKNYISEYKKSDVSCKLSTSTLFFKMHGQKSRDNFANLLLKIQNDLNALTNKLSNLEDRIQL